MPFQALYRPRVPMSWVAVLALHGAPGIANAAEVTRAAEIPPPIAELSDMKGQYGFADGRLLTITGSTYRIRAQLDGCPAVLMVRDGASGLRAADNSFSLIFKQHDNGTITTVELEDASQCAAEASGAKSQRAAGSVPKPAMKSSHSTASGWP